MKVTVAAHFFTEEKENVKKEDISMLEKKLKDASKLFKTFITETKFSEEGNKYQSESKVFFFFFLKLLFSNTKFLQQTIWL